MHYKFLYILLLVSFFIISCEVGCNDESACNYNADATLDDDSCLTNDCVGVCGGSAEVDECGVKPIINPLPPR